MAIAHEPGEEIELDVPGKRKYFAVAMSWREQKEYAQMEEHAKSEDGQQVDTDLIIDAVLTRLIRTDPPIELTKEGIAAALDYGLIWSLNSSIKYNVSWEEKKS